MANSIKVKILDELSKPLHANEIYLGDTIRDRLGIQNNNANDDWLVFYKELSYCIEGGLVAFINSWDKDEFEKVMKSHGQGTFLYLNCLVNRGIRITPQGETWLAQMKNSDLAERTKETPIASNNNILSKNTIGLINIGSIFNFENFKFEGGLIGGKRTKAQMELGIIIMIIEIGIAGIAIQYIQWNMTDNWITAIVLLVTAAVFFGVENLIKSLTKQ